MERRLACTTIGAIRQHKQWIVRSYDESINQSIESNRIESNRIESNRIESTKDRRNATMQRYWYNHAALLVIYSTILSLTSTAYAFDAEMPVLPSTQHTILTQALYYKKANADVTMTYIKANLDNKSAKLILDTTHTESVVVQSQSKNNHKGSKYARFSWW